MGALFIILFIGTLVFSIVRKSSGTGSHGFYDSSDHSRDEGGFFGGDGGGE